MILAVLCWIGWRVEWLYRREKAKDDAMATVKARFVNLP
jgi:hypothetical protein